jgi:hypothetical protein
MDVDILIGHQGAVDDVRWGMLGLNVVMPLSFLAGDFVSRAPL